MACPLTAATTGAGWSKTARKAAASEVMKRSVYSDPPSTIARRSTPAEKHLPAPVTTPPVEVPHRRDDRVEQLEVEGVHRR
jgi:hypothetical protein